MTMSRLNLIKGLGPVLQLAEGWTVDLPTEVHRQLNERTNPTWPTHWFVPRLTGRGRVPGCIFCHGKLGCQSWGGQLWAYRCGSSYARFDPAHPGVHAQPGRDGSVPPERMECLWY